MTDNPTTPERETVARIIDPILEGVALNGDCTAGSRMGIALAKADAILARGCPEGWVMVPKEPSREMWAAGADSVYGQRKKPRVHHDKLVGGVWTAMIAAAPQPSGGE